MSNDSKNIKLILTGGTIGASSEENGVLSSNADANSSVLIDNLFDSQPSYKELIDFQISSPLNILSENLSIAHWDILIQELRNTDFNKFDGIIITHGTDTVAYTANLLSVLLEGTSIPVFIVASSKPLSDPDANGYANFGKAVDMIIEGVDTGVYVPYKNRDSELIVHDACRLIQCEDLSPDFKSAHHKLNNLTTIKNDICAALYISHETILLNQIQKISKNILSLTPQPGLDYRNYDLDYVDTVLHRTYHSSTLAIDVAQTTGSSSKSTNNIQSSYSVNYIMDKCEEKDIPFYISPILSNSKQVYDTTDKLKKRGAIPLFDMTFEMTYIYLLLV